SFMVSSEKKSTKINETLSAENNKLRDENKALSIQLTRQVAEFENLDSELQKEKDRFQNFEKDFNDKFENLAHKILLDKTARFADLNKENIGNILKPLQEKIKEFESKVGKTNEDFIKGHAELGKQLE